MKNIKDTNFIRLSEVKTFEKEQKTNNFVDGYENTPTKTKLFMKKTKNKPGGEKNEYN